MFHVGDDGIIGKLVPIMVGDAEDIHELVAIRGDVAIVDGEVG